MLMLEREQRHSFRSSFSRSVMSAQKCRHRKDACILGTRNRERSRVNDNVIT